MLLSFSVSLSVIIILFFSGGTCESTRKGLPLNEYINHFEPLFYDQHRLQEMHRRSTMEQPFLFQFVAHNRLFQLRLQWDPSVFAEDTQFENACTSVQYDTSRALTGYLEDEEQSSVEAVVTASGVLDGVVKVGGEEYFIEPARNYLHPPHDFHSVIYKLSDVLFLPKNLTCLSHLIQTHQNNKAYVTFHKHHSIHNHHHEPNAEHSCCGSKTSDVKSLLHKHKKRYLHFYEKSTKKGLRDNRSKLDISDRSIKYKRKLRHFSYQRHSPKNLQPDYYKHRYSDRKMPIKRFGSSGFIYANKFKTSASEDFIASTSSYKSILNKMEFNFKNKSVKSGFNKFDHYDYESYDLFADEFNDDSHEDHAGSYSNNSHSSGSLELSRDASDAEYNTTDTPKAKNTDKYKGNDSKRLPPDQKDSAFIDIDLPYWRELDALYYTEDGRTGSSEPYGVRSIQRTQWAEDRGQRHVAVDRRKSTCLLYLQADHLFYQRMGSEEACIEAMTRHVQRVNSIYRSADFDQDGRPDNISFLIKRIKVHTSPDHSDYRFVGSYGVEKFLELFSEDDYDAFCLAYMFTYRDFEGGTLGLAWTGDLKNAGGVCEKNGHYRGSLKSLNTGIITLLNYGKHVPPVVSHVTLAHEIGHNFGSPHDPEDDKHCTPGGDHGNYIMFARATSGDKRNNNRFSPCSLKSINAVLNTKARSVKGCFTEPLDAVCGNEVVEGLEECDCGWEEDCSEPCCFPMRVNPPENQPPCRLRPAAFCSPSQGPCCSHDCRLKYGVMCREDNGCRTASYCDGQGPQCPSSTKKPNKTVCNEELVCYNGECTGSICMAYGLESCQCIRKIHDPIIRSCELCCKLPSDELSCKSSFEWNFVPYDVPDLYAKPGAPCDNYNGYCDVHQSCREIDPSGPLATLSKLLLSPEGAVILRRWLSEKWWGIVFLLLAITITVVISLRLLSKGHTKGFLSNLLPHQRDFRFCHSGSTTRTHSTYLVNRNSRYVSRSRVSTAPENGWV